MYDAYVRPHAGTVHVHVIEKIIVHSHIFNMLKMFFFMTFLYLFIYMCIMYNV